jgi:hypothetical protein
MRREREGGERRRKAAAESGYDLIKLREKRGRFRCIAFLLPSITVRGKQFSFLKSKDIYCVTTRESENYRFNLAPPDNAQSADLCNSASRKIQLCSITFF